MTRQRSVVAIVTLALVAGCAAVPPSSGTASPEGMRRDAAMSGEWRPLIDPSLSAWRGYKEQGLPAGWRVADGVLMKDGVAEDLISRDEFADFELAFEWKLQPGGNAGVFYRATEQYDKIYWSGTEYQLLDDARHPDGRNRLTSAGAAYSLYAPPAGVVKPAGEWNASRIVANGHHVEHWLNGQKVVEYESQSADWLAKVAASKFHDYPAYGLASRGHIGLQGDHTGALALRDVRIRVLR